MRLQKTASFITSLFFPGFLPVNGTVFLFLRCMICLCAGYTPFQDDEEANTQRGTTAASARRNCCRAFRRNGSEQPTLRLSDRPGGLKCNASQTLFRVPTFNSSFIIPHSSFLIHHFLHLALSRRISCAVPSGKGREFLCRLI